jgi:metal-sulfur cluster biosynthetic enzyme
MSVITNNHTRCQEALSALEKVEDPEIGLNIVDLGLVYQVDFDEDARKIYVSMTLTTQFCPMGAAILDSVRNALEKRFPGDEIQVDLVFDPPWNYEMISETGQNFLNK